MPNLVTGYGTMYYIFIKLSQIRCLSNDNHFDIFGVSNVTIGHEKQSNLVLFFRIFKRYIFIKLSQIMSQITVHNHGIFSAKLKE